MIKFREDYLTEWDYRGVSFYRNNILISFVKWPSIWQLIKYKLEGLLK